MTREEAIKRLKEARFTVQPYLYMNEAFDVAIEALSQPERPKGRWHTLHETKLTKTVECIHCNTPFRYKKKDNLIVDDFNYCPNCGREMKGERR